MIVWVPFSMKWPSKSLYHLSSFMDWILIVCWNLKAQAFDKHVSPRKGKNFLVNLYVMELIRLWFSSPESFPLRSYALVWFWDQELKKEEKSNLYLWMAFGFLHTHVQLRMRAKACHEVSIRPINITSAYSKPFITRISRPISPRTKEQKKSNLPKGHVQNWYLIQITCPEITKWT